ELSRSCPADDVRRLIGRDRRRPEAVGAVVVLERLLDPEQINHDWSHGDDALIDSRRGPRGPASLRGTRDHKTVDTYPAPRATAAEGRDRIHGPHHALGHREPQRPRFVSGPQ